jgi:hypothetical protein
MAARRFLCCVVLGLSLAASPAQGQSAPVAWLTDAAGRCELALGPAGGSPPTRRCRLTALAWNAGLRTRTVPPGSAALPNASGSSVRNARPARPRPARRREHVQTGVSFSARGLLPPAAAAAALASSSATGPTPSAPDTRVNSPAEGDRRDGDGLSSWFNRPKPASRRSGGD